LNHPLPLLMAALGIFQIGLVLAVQNDAYNTSIGKNPCTTTSDDAYFFTMVGILFVLSIVLIEERAGLLLGPSLAGSIVYSSPSYALKRRFPANQKMEGLTVRQFLAALTAHVGVVAFTLSQTIGD
ncbi:MAG: hypothetical protein V1685_04635, partial [Parcubacteria group bacterium]